MAFVTPRYGPEIMGGAETAVRQLAEHLRALTDWEAEVHTTCALDAITWDDVLEPGTTELNGVTVHRHPSAHGRLPDFYGLDGTVRLAPRLATREQGKRWVDYNGPVSPELVDAVCASDADVVAFSPYLYHPTVATIGKVRVPAVFHPAAHDEPALYLSVFRGTFGDADAFCFYTASERTLVEKMYQVAERPQIVLGLGVGDAEGAGRPGGELLGAGGPPLPRQRRAGRRAQGLEDAGVVLRHLQGAPPRTARPGPRRAGRGGDPAPPRHRGDGRGQRARQVGHRARRAAWRSRRPRSSRSPSW